MAKLLRDNLAGLLDAPHPFWEAVQRAQEPTEMDESMQSWGGTYIDPESGKVKKSVARVRAVWLMLTAAKEAGRTVEIAFVDSEADLGASSRWIRLVKGTVVGTAIDPAFAPNGERWLIQQAAGLTIINPNLVTDIDLQEN